MAKASGGFGGGGNAFEDNNPFLAQDKTLNLGEPPNPSTTDKAIINPAAGVKTAAIASPSAPGIPKGLNSLFAGDTHRQKFNGADAAQISALGPALKQMGFGVQITRSGHAIVHTSKTSGPTRGALKAQRGPGGAMKGAGGKGGGKGAAGFGFSPSGSKGGNNLTLI